MTLEALLDRLHDGLHLLQQWSDVGSLPEMKSAAVIGGGLLGLEAAKATLDLGLKTSVVEFNGRLMPRQIDQQGSDVLGGFLALHVGGEADAGRSGAVLDHFFQAGEGATADKQDVGGINLDKILLGMLASAFGWHAGGRTLDDFQ